MEKVKKLLWILVMIPMVATYGGIYSDQQHWIDGWSSHNKNVTHHLMALNWAIFPPMWIIAPFITSGYEHGFQFRHHHTKFCGKGEFSNCEEAPWIP